MFRKLSFGNTKLSDAPVDEDDDSSVEDSYKETEGTNKKQQGGRRKLPPLPTVYKSAKSASESNDEEGDSFVKKTGTKRKKEASEMEGKEAVKKTPVKSPSKKVPNVARKQQAGVLSAEAEVSEKGSPGKSKRKSLKSGGQQQRAEEEESESGVHGKLKRKREEELASPRKMVTRSRDGTPSKHTRSHDKPAAQNPPPLPKRPKTAAAKETPRRSTGGLVSRATSLKKPVVNSRKPHSVVSLLNVKNGLPVERVYCDGCGAEGTILDCTLCGNAFSLTECECGLEPGEETAEQYGKDWKAGVHAGCFPCTSSGRTEPIAMAPPCFYPRQGEVSMLILTVQPRQCDGEWKFQCAETVTSLVENTLPSGSFAHLGYEFETEEELSQVLDHARAVLQRPADVLPRGTRLGANCRAVLYFFVHGRAETKQITAIDREDAQCMFPVIQTNYTKDGAVCWDLSQFLNIVQRLLLSYQKTFTVNLSMFSIGTCNVLRTEAGRRKEFSLQTNVANSMLQSLSSESGINILIPIGSPDILDLVMDAVSVIRWLALDQRTVVELAVRQGCKMTKYQLFSQKNRIVESSVSAISSTKNVKKPKQKKTNEVSLNEFIDKFEKEHSVGSRVENITLNHKPVKGGWAVQSTVLREWLESRAEGIKVSGQDVSKLLKNRQGWDQGLVSFGTSDKRWCWVYQLQ